MPVIPLYPSQPPSTSRQDPHAAVDTAFESHGEQSPACACSVDERHACLAERIRHRQLPGSICESGDESPLWRIFEKCDCALATGFSIVICE